MQQIDVKTPGFTERLNPASCWNLIQMSGDLVTKRMQDAESLSAILGIVAATAAHETHDLARVLAFTAAAAVPYLGLELKLALQRRAQIGAVAAGRLDFAPQQRI